MRVRQDAVGRRETAKSAASCRSLEAPFLAALIARLVGDEDQSRPTLHHGAEGPMHLRGEHAPNQAPHALDGELESELLPIGPGGGQRIVNLRYRNQPGPPGNVLAPQSVRVSLAIPALM